MYRSEREINAVTAARYFLAVNFFFWGGGAADSTLP